MRYILTWFDRLADGDPLAIGLASFFGLLFLIALVFFIIDQRDNAKERAKASQKRLKK